jgi:hypothetical protein
MIPLVVLLDCAFYMHNWNPQKKSMRLLSDLTNQISQGYFRERSLEAVLSLRKNLRHALLEVAADRTPSLHGVRMNRKRRRCRTGAVYIQQRDQSRRTRKRTRSVLAPLCYDQARFRELRERLSNESGICVHAARQSRGRYFLAVVELESRHDVRGNRKLDAFH